jgi:hypothetical protein
MVSITVKRCFWGKKSKAGVLPIGTVVIELFMESNWLKR